MDALHRLQVPHAEPSDKAIRADCSSFRRCHGGCRSFLAELGTSWLSLVPLGDLRRAGDDLGEARVVARRHDVYPTDARRLAQLLDQFVADLATLTRGIAGAFHAGHDGVGND